MATYNDLVNGALRLVGIIGDGETASGYQATNALFTLKEMLDSWNADDLMIYTTSIAEYVITTNNQTFTIGPLGDIDVDVRPSELGSAVIVQNRSTSQPVTLPMSVLSVDDWQTIRSKNSSSNIPRFVYMNGDWPLATVYMWPKPLVSDTSIQLTFSSALDANITLATTENLPPSYRQAIRYNLAVLLAS